MRSLLLCSFLALLVGGCGEPQTFEELKKAGQKAYTRAEYKIAREYLIKALHFETRDRQCLYLTGLSYERDYLYDSALFYLKRADLLHPVDREINLRIYDLALKSDQPQYALTAIGVLIATGDPVEKWTEMIATLHIAQGEMYIGYKNYRDLLANDRENPESWLKLANAAAGTDSIEFGVEILDTAIEKFGSIPEFLASQGAMLASLRRYQKAEEVYRELIAIDSSMYIYHIGLANVLSTQDNREAKEEALAIYRRLQPVAPPEFRVDSLIAGLRRSLKQ
jgi:tetratricopeptide (TPR) repeat protein